MADTNNEATSPAPAALVVKGIPVGVPVPVDAELDPTSDNPVSNKAVCEKFDEVENTLSEKATINVTTATVSTSALGLAATSIPITSKIISVRQRSFTNGAVIPYNNGSTWALKCFYVTDWSAIANTNVIVDIYTIS